MDIKLFDDRVNDLDLKEEREWLIQAAGYVFHEDSTEANHWASYHAQKQRSRCTTTVVNGVLPIFDAKSTDPSLVKHVIDRTS